MRKSIYFKSCRDPCIPRMLPEGEYRSTWAGAMPGIKSKTPGWSELRRRDAICLNSRRIQVLGDVLVIRI